MKGRKGERDSKKSSNIRQGAEKAFFAIHPKREKAR
jgi:hypothetical protein